MDKHIVKLWEERKSEIRALFSGKHPSGYKEVIRNIISVLTNEECGTDTFTPDPERIHMIDDGDYQGTLVFIIGEKGYQPYNYWYVRVFYGSCSVCDTLLNISGYDDEKPTEEQINQYMTLSLHIVQGLKEMGDFGIVGE